MTMLVTGGGFIKMALPFVGDNAKNLGGFFSRCEAGQKHPSTKRRVSFGVSLGNTQKKKPFKNGFSISRFKRRRATRYNKKAPAQNTWAFLSVDGLTFPQRLQQRRQVFLRKTLMQRQQLLIRCLALPCRTQVHNLLQPLLQRR